MFLFHISVKKFKKPESDCNFPAVIISNQLILLGSKLIFKIFFRILGTKIGAMFTMKGIKEISKQMDYRETGGSPLLGTAKPVLKAHGSSDALAFKNAVRQAKDFVERNVIAEMEKVLSENTEG